jgi:hypothetical protein
MTSPHRVHSVALFVTPPADVYSFTSRTRFSSTRPDMRAVSPDILITVIELRS